MENNPWKLTGEERRRFLCKEVKRINESEYLSAYNSYVESQKQGFLNTMLFTNEIIKSLKREGEISEYVIINGRIKSPKSSLKNDTSKALDDVFGIEILTTTEEELKAIADKLNQYMKATKLKKHNKKNGYKAVHQTLALTKDINKNEIPEDTALYYPLIEYQFKTFEVKVKCNGGTADHTVYKGETKEEIQRKYDNGEFSILTNIPRMWAIIGDNLIEFTPEETLRNMYPFLRLNRSNDKSIGE